MVPPPKAVNAVLLFETDEESISSTVPAAAYTPELRGVDDH